MRSGRVSRIFPESARVNFEIAWARSKQLTDQCAAADVLGHGQQFLDVLVQVLSTAIGDGIGHMGNWSGHERQSAGFATVPGLVFELGQKGDLEVVKIMVISRQFPATAILHLGFDDIPVFIVVETVSRNRGCDGGHERWWVEILRVGMRDVVRGQRSFTGVALMESLCAVSSVLHL